MKKMKLTETHIQIKSNLWHTQNQIKKLNLSDCSVQIVKYYEKSQMHAPDKTFGVRMNSMRCNISETNHVYIHVYYNSWYKVS